MAAGNSIFVPDRKAPLVRSLHAEAERVIRDWPAAGRQAYALRFNAEAAETLAQAARGGDVELMASVAERWFHTPAGAEASLLVGVHAFARGDVFHAAYRLERIRRHSLDADRLEPALSLRLAVCWLQLGERRQAEAVLHALQQKHPQFAAKLAGLEQPTALSLDAICKRLELQLHASTLGDGGPPVYSAWDAKQTAGRRWHALAEAGSPARAETRSAVGNGHCAVSQGRRGQASRRVAGRAAAGHRQYGLAAHGHALSGAQSGQR